jgi:hypothetical protein
VLVDFFTGSPFVVSWKRISPSRSNCELPQASQPHVAAIAAGGRISPLCRVRSFPAELASQAAWVEKRPGIYECRRGTDAIIVVVLRQLPQSSENLIGRPFVINRYEPMSSADSFTLKKRPGIYECQRGTDTIVVVVLRQLLQNAHNALWHLFSPSPEQVAFAVNSYRQRSDETSSLLNQLFEGYKNEGLPVPYTMADFRRDYVKEHLKDLTPEERLEGLPPEERIKGLPTEERLKGLPLDERLKDVSPEDIERYLKGLQARKSSKCPSSSPDEGQ